MDIEEYAKRFRLQNTDVPEQFYGRLAKIENLNKLATANLTPVAPVKTNASVRNTANANTFMPGVISPGTLCMFPSTIAGVTDLPPGMPSAFYTTGPPLPPLPKLSLRRDTSNGTGASSSWFRPGGSTSVAQAPDPNMLDLLCGQLY